MGEKKAPAGALQDALQDVYRFLRKKKAPAGALQDAYRFFEGKKKTAGALKTRIGRFLGNVSIF